MTPRNKRLAALAVLFLLLGLLSQVTSRRRLATSEGGGFRPVFPQEADAATIASLKAWVGSSADEALTLEKQGETWVVPTRYDWPVKQSQIDRLLDDLGDLRGELRASGKDEVLPDFQLDDDSALHVVAAGPTGAELFHLLAGKSSTGGGSFVRREGSQDVLLIAKNPRSTFGIWGDQPTAPDAKRWIDLQVLNLDRKAVDEITLTDGKRTLTLTKVIPAAADTAAAPDRSQWTWKADKSGTPDKGKADRVLTALVNLRAVDVADPANADAYGLDEGAKVAEIRLADGSVTRVAFGKPAEAEKQVYFRVEGGLPAVIYESTVDRIFVKREDLKPEKNG